MSVSSVSFSVRSKVSSASASLSVKEKKTLSTNKIATGYASHSYKVIICDMLTITAFSIREPAGRDNHLTS